MKYNMTGAQRHTIQRIKFLLCLFKQPYIKLLYIDREINKGNNPKNNTKQNISSDKTEL